MAVVLIYAVINSADKVRKLWVSLDGTASGKNVAKFHRRCKSLFELFVFRQFALRRRWRRFLFRVRSPKESHHHHSFPFSFVAEESVAQFPRLDKS